MIRASLGLASRGRSGASRQIGRHGGFAAVINLIDCPRDPWIIKPSLIVVIWTFHFDITKINQINPREFLSIFSFLFINFYWEKNSQCARSASKRILIILPKQRLMNRGFTTISKRSSDQSWNFLGLI
jgi:hypothetical protein